LGAVLVLPHALPPMALGNMQVWSVGGDVLCYSSRGGAAKFTLAAPAKDGPALPPGVHSAKKW
jgi:hypothetical protein